MDDRDKEPHDDSVLVVVVVVAMVIVRNPCHHAFMVVVAVRPPRSCVYRIIHGYFRNNGYLSATTGF
jgi:hypothetical protein